MDIQTQRLWLKLASTDLNVTARNAIDIDRGILLASNRMDINSMVLISENFDDIIQSEEYGRVVKESRDISELKRLASLRDGIEKARLLSLIGYYYAFMPDDMGYDSAMVYLSDARALAEKFKDKKTISQILAGTGKSNLEFGEIERGNRDFQESIRIATENGDHLSQARALAYWGTYSPFSPETTIERIRILKQADSLFAKLNNIHERISTVTNIAFLSFAADRPSDSKAAALLALELQQKISFPFTHYTNDLLSFLLLEHEGRFGTAFGYTLAAHKSIEMTGDSIPLGKVAMRLGMAFWNSLQYKEAEEWLRKGLNAFMTGSGNYLGLYNSMNVLCNLLKSKGRSQEAIGLIYEVIEKYPPADPLELQEVFLTLAENQAELKQFSAAELNLVKADSIESEVHKRSGTIMRPYINYKIGLVNFKLNKFEKSRQYLTKALESPIGLGMEFQARGQFMLASIDSAQGDYKSALSNFKRYILIVDSTYSLQQSLLNGVLRVQYETEGKDNNIRILEQQAALHEAKIREDKFIKATMIIAVLILFLFIGLLYGRFRIKQKANCELEEQRRKIIEKNDLLAQLLREKEWLLKEVHHRVKNNLQIVISLLNTQSNYLDDEAAVKAIRESQDRMYAISLIHQKLYKSDESSSIDINEYVYELLDHLEASMSVSGRIKFNVDVNNVHLDTTQAVLLGLILNEAISNSIKYAFDDFASGEISVSLKPTANSDAFVLLISDNGRGLPPEFDQLNNPSFGMRLMKGLAKQMGGTFDIISDNGVKIEIRFADRALDRIIVKNAKNVRQAYAHEEIPVESNI